MDNKEKVLDLLDQIIEVAEQADHEYKTEMLEANKGSQAVGEGWMVFHLKALKELMNEG